MAGTGQHRSQRGRLCRPQQHSLGEDMPACQPARKNLTTETAGLGVWGIPLASRGDFCTSAPSHSNSYSQHKEQGESMGLIQS